MWIRGPEDDQDASCVESKLEGAAQGSEPVAETVLKVDDEETRHCLENRDAVGVEGEFLEEVAASVGAESGCKDGRDVGFLNEGGLIVGVI